MPVQSLRVSFIWDGDDKEYRFRELPAVPAVGSSITFQPDRPGVGGRSGRVMRVEWRIGQTVEVRVVMAPL